MTGAREPGAGLPVTATDALSASGGSTAARYVRAVVARSGTTFLWGMRILPRPRREAMYAIYAFCREVDDIADEPGAREAKLAGLEEWRAEIARLYEGRPRHPIAQALLRPVGAFDLPREEFLAVIDGMETDACGPVRMPTREDLARYCRRVAGAVGLLSIRVFGETGPAAREFALTLGEALQTTNILRDLAEDAARDRLYLPADLLAAHGITGDDVDSVLADPALGAACADLGRHARNRFAHARALLDRCDRRRMRPAVLMLAAYERLLDRLEARGWDRPDRPVRLSRPERLWIVLRHGLI